MRSCGCLFALWLLCRIPALAQDGQAHGIDVAVRNQANQTISGVRVRLTDGQGQAGSGETDANAHIRFTDLKPGKYEITAGQGGFETLREAGLDLTQSDALSLQLVVLPAAVRRESIDVKGTTAAVDQGSSPPIDAPVGTVKELPSRPATVADALPMVPGGVRSPGMTKQFNPEDLHSNTGDPAYEFFFGQRGRRFTADFDVLF
jgi:hypothetical protein